MSLIPLYGYIPNPNKPGEGNPLYVIKERQVSPTVYEYKGMIGHGVHEGEMKGEDYNSTSLVNDSTYPVKFLSFDMREFEFTYDTEKNLVTLNTYWRFECYDEEAKSLIKNVETDVPDDPEDENFHECYPYVRYPRSKDGIALSRAFDFIFQGKDVKVFAPKEEYG